MTISILIFIGWILLKTVVRSNQHCYTSSELLSEKHYKEGLESLKNGFTRLNTDIELQLRVIHLLSAINRRTDTVGTMGIMNLVYCVRCRVDG